VVDNAGAARIKLREAEIQAIDQELPLGRRRGGVPTL
jgi:hypothetical protein